MAIYVVHYKRLNISEDIESYMYPLDKIFPKFS